MYLTLSSGWAGLAWASPHGLSAQSSPSPSNHRFQECESKAARSPENESQKPHYIIAAAAYQGARSGESTEKWASLLKGSKTKHSVAIFKWTQTSIIKLCLQIIKPKSCTVICYLAPFIYWPMLFPYLYHAEDWWSSPSFFHNWQLVSVTKPWTAMNKMLSTVNGSYVMKRKYDKHCVT